jgi:hypothetical protein
MRCGLFSPVCLVCVGIVFLSTSVAPAGQRITQADLLRRVIDPGRLMLPPSGERTGMISSRTPRGELARGEKGAADLLQAGGNWVVLAELEGPGAITRIWAAQPAGYLRLAFDETTVVELEFIDIFTGVVAPFGKPLCYAGSGGGYNCYFPMGFATGCRILARDFSSDYQINYVRFPTGTSVETFNLVLDGEARQALAEIEEVFRAGLSERQLFGRSRPYAVTEFQELRAGEKLVTETFPGGGVIRALHVSFADLRPEMQPYVLHQTVLRIFFDGEERPSVEVPLVDFFGSGFRMNRYNSLLCGTDLWTDLPGEATREDLNRVGHESRFCYCYFPMPFQDAARIEVEAPPTLPRGSRLRLMLYVRVDPQRPPAEALRFHAKFRREDPCRQEQFALLEAGGAGRLVGLTLNVDCPRKAWWGAGGEIIWVDKAPSPQYLGTGSGDLLGATQALAVEALPLHGVTSTGPYGKSSGYRWFVPDCVNFEKSIRAVLENRQADDARDTYYGCVVYWYAEPQAGDHFSPLELADLTPPGLRIPGSVEVENHIVGSDWGQILPQKFAEGGELSGGAAATITTDQPVRVNIPSERERIARLSLRMHQIRRFYFESVEVFDEGGALVGRVEYDKNNSTGIYPVGVVALRRGDNFFTLRCSRPATVDCWIIDDPPRTANGPEAEELAILEGEARVSAEYGLSYSGGVRRVFEFAHAGQAVTLDLPVERRERYMRVQLRVGIGPLGGRFQALLDGQPLGDPFDTYCDTPDSAVAVLGLVEGAGGRHHRLTLRAEPRAGGAVRLALDAVELIRIYSPVAIEFENMPIVSSEGFNPALESLAQASNEGYVWCRPARRGGAIEFEVPIARAGRYRLSALYVRSPQGGIVQAYVNGEAAGRPCDTWGSMGLVGPWLLGTYDVPAGPLHLRIKVEDRNPRSDRYYFGLDCLLVEPVPP